MTKLPQLRLARTKPKSSKLHGVPVTQEEVDAKEGDLPWDQLELVGFSGKLGEHAMFSVSGSSVCVVGLGESGTREAQSWRRAGVTFARAAKRSTAASFEVSDAELGALAEGLVLGAYEYDQFRSSAPERKLNTVTLVGRTGKRAEVTIDYAQAVASAVCLARDLVNEPGGSLTPAKFATVAKKVAKANGLGVQVMGLPEIRQAKLGGLLGVSRGSELPPRFVELEWKGSKGAPVLALIGKGVTFDAGGLSIKSSAGMSKMKCDMAGAAAVLGAMSALAALAPKITVKAYIPLTDNMLGGDATRVGDVLTIRNGKTVEVLNTDAEGRLILADALSLASEAKPDGIVDLATLTGAAVVSLGEDYAALMANDDGLADQVLRAAQTCGELLWRMPLPGRYRKQLDSSVADLKNIGTPYGASLTAGLFLQEFVPEEIPWAHLDIAGPAFSDGGSDIGPKGGTGFAVRTLLGLIDKFSAPRSS